MSHRSSSHLQLLLGSVSMNFISYSKSDSVTGQLATLQEEQVALSAEKEALKDQLSIMHIRNWV